MPGTPRHVALLRGINVGGHNRVPMATLRELFVEAGASEVTTYIQSGNVVFAAPAKQVAAIAKAVSAGIDRELGLTIPLITRSAAALTEVAREHPFADAVAEPKHLMVAFCDLEPAAAKAKALDPTRSPGDLFEVRKQEVFFAFPNGSARSKIDATWLDRSLGVTSTWRNWLTVRKLAEMVG